jgi:hypothetical protein
MLGKRVIQAFVPSSAWREKPLYGMSPESGRRFRDNGMRKNKKLKRLT